jgi:hypothetical protein
MDITDRPWTAGRFTRPDGLEHTSNEDVAETIRFSCLKSDSTELYGVIGMRDGEEEVVCYTGNGPKSAQNAAHIAAVFNVIGDLQSHELEAIINAWRKADE